MTNNELQLISNALEKLKHDIDNSFEQATKVIDDIEIQ